MEQAEVFTVVVKLSFTAHDAAEARRTAIAMLTEIADEWEVPTRDLADAPEFLSWFVADAVLAGVEV